MGRAFFLEEQEDERDGGLEALFKELCNPSKMLRN